MSNDLSVSVKRAHVFICLLAALCLCRGFKALKQQTKINFHRRRHEDALQSYTQLLSYTKSAVTRNYSEKSINNILDYVSNASDVPLATMERFYSVTNSALEEAKNERLSVRTDLKLARLWLARQEWGRLTRTLKELRAYCTTAEGTDDQSKGTILLEIFALEIQMYSEQANFKKLKVRRNEHLSIFGTIPDASFVRPPYRRRMTPPFKSKALYLTLASWASSVNAVAKCICQKVSMNRHLMLPVSS